MTKTGGMSSTEDEASLTGPSLPEPSVVATPGAEHISNGADVRTLEQKAVPGVYQLAAPSKVPQNRQFPLNDVLSEHQPPASAHDFPFERMTALSVKGIPGVNQIPHPYDPRPVSTKAVPGLFQIPTHANLTEHEQRQINEILHKRQDPARGGKNVRDFPRKWPAKSSGISHATLATTRRRSSVPAPRRSRMPSPVDPRDASYGKGRHFGHRVLNRKRPRDTSKSKKDSDEQDIRPLLLQGKTPATRAFTSNIAPTSTAVLEPLISTTKKSDVNHRWEEDFLLEQQAKAMKAERTKPSQWKYRYICYLVGCGVSSNNAREFSRHFNHSDPPIHPGQTCVPAKVIKVLYKDWLRDEDLYATKYATDAQEFYDELRKEVPLSDGEEDIHGEVDDSGYLTGDEDD